MERLKVFATVGTLALNLGILRPGLQKSNTDQTEPVGTRKR